MKQITSRLILALAISGFAAGHAMADKTKSSDPAPSSRSSDSGVVYCNPSGTRCWVQSE